MNISKILILIVTLVSIVNAQDDWQSLEGPRGGKINDLLKTVSGKLYAATDGGGIYVSMNDGDSWQEMNTGLNDLTVHSLTVNSVGMVFAGTASGIYRKPDADTDWMLGGTGNPAEEIWDLEMSTDNSTVLAATFSGIYRSTDEGATWIKSNTGLTSTFAVSLTASHAGIFAGTLGGGIFKSTNNGGNWAQSSSGLTANNIVALHTSAAGTIFAGTATSGIFKSQNEGSLWTEFNDNLSDLNIKFITSKGDDIFASTGSGVFVAPGGAAWIMRNTGLGAVSVISLMGLNSGEVYAGMNGSGIAKTFNNGILWQYFNTGLNASVVNGVSVDLNQNILAATDGAGIFGRQADSADWNVKITGLSNLYVNTLVQIEAGKYLAGTEGDGVFFSNNNGDDWQQRNTNLTDLNVRSFVIKSNGTLFAATWGGGVFRTTDNGINWQAVNVGLSNPFVNELAINENEDIFAATSNRVFRLLSGSTNWEHLISGITLTEVHSVAIDPAGVIIIGGETGVFRSVNNGDTWVDKSAGLNASFIYSLSYDPSGRLYAGSLSGDGIHISDDNGENWNTYSTGISNSSITSLVLGDDYRMYAGTNGSGLFRTVQVTSVPEVPGLIYPDDNAVDVEINPLIQWAEAKGAESYSIEISENMTFNPLVFSDTGISDNQIQITLLDTSKTFYWHVRAANAKGQSQFSETWKFTTGKGLSKPDVPVLNAPVDGATNVSLSPTLNWNEAAGAAMYNVQVSRDTGFTDLVFSAQNISITSAIASGLDYASRYYWHVNAFNPAGTSDWSAAFRFTTIPPVPDDPDLVAPPNHAENIPVPQIFSWQKNEFATSYELQVSVTNDFLNLISEETVTDTFFQVSNLQFNKTYFWRVRASNQTGLSGWSNVWDFTTESGLDAPQLTYPADDATDISVVPVLSWNSISTADYYNIRIAEDGNMTSIVETQDSLETNAYTAQNLQFDTDYYWQVIAKNASGAFGISEIWRFRTREYVADLNVNVSVNFPDNSDNGSYSPTDYKIVGLPGSSNLGFEQLLGGTAGEDWIVYWDNGEADNYLVEYDGSNIFRFATGRAFWMIHKGPLTVNQQIASAALNDNLEAEIILHSGWNLITNPFPFDIAWQNIKEVNGTDDPIFKYEEGGFSQSAQLLPQVGYYFFNRNDLSVLKVPVKLILQKQAFDKNLVWRLDLKYQNPLTAENSIQFGVRKDSKAGLDAHDIYKPRSFGGLPDIFIKKTEWNENFPVFATDFRPDGKMLYRFEFTVSAEANSYSALSCENLFNIPASMQIYLIDKLRKKSVHLGNGEVYEYQTIAAEENFELLIGDQQSIDKELTMLVPDQYVLGQNFPNPFNPLTYIPFQLPEPGRVKINIYDLSGRKIASLANNLEFDSGYHLVKWDSRDRFGNRVASGVYFYEMVLPSKTRFVKKMILMN